MTKIDLIAPSGGFEKDLIPKIESYLLERGLAGYIPENSLGEDLISANTDAIRFELLKDALFNEQAAFIWCIRGGCGASRLLPYLKKLTPPKQQKALMGFSDITALHLFLNQVWGWQPIHGAGARQIVEQDITMSAQVLTEEILEGKRPLLKYALTPLNEKAEGGFSCDASLTGGNLKIVETSLATFWQIETVGKVLLLEEINEYAYRVDRCLVHLQQAGIFDGVAAVIFGEFTFANQPTELEKIKAVLKRFAQSIDRPVFTAPFFGHGKSNSPWFYGPASIRNQELVQ